MAKPLRSQLNQVRAWVQQGRTDAWIAHQLDVSVAELQEFRRRHELSAAEESTDEHDLRDEIEAEIEAALDAEPEEDEQAEEDSGEGDEDADAEASEESADSEEQPKRRRRRRGGRGRGRGKAALQATLQHGEPDGYGLWLDPAVADNPVYTEHWAGHSEVEVDVQPDQIVVKRAD